MESDRKKLKITVVVDNPRSWFHVHAKHLCGELKRRGHTVRFCRHARDVQKCDVAFFLSCEEIVSSDILNRNVHNIVVHSSALPKGRGMSPLTWQIIAGKKKITTTLFEMAEKVDTGRIYLQKDTVFTGHELIDEMREAQGSCIVELALAFVDAYPNVKSRPQRGTATYYPRRRQKDSEIDVTRSIKEQFNLLRVVDNEQYPATFQFLGHTYILKIYKKKD